MMKQRTRFHSQLPVMAVISPEKAPCFFAATVLMFLLTILSGPALAQISPNTRFYPPSESAKLFRVSSMTSFNNSNEGLTLTESPDKFTVVTPLIGGKASVEALNEDMTRNWKIGYVQVLLDSKIHITYEKGVNGWVMPVLPISDSTATEFPFMDGKNGYAWGYGTANLYWDDRFTTNMNWGQSLPNDEYDSDSRLTGFYRDQSFVDWLIAYDEQGDRVFIIKESRWDAHIAVDVDPDAPLGQRAHVRDFWMKAYYPDNIMPSVNAAWFNAPTANQGQELQTLEYQQW